MLAVSAENKAWWDGHDQGYINALQDVLRDIEDCRKRPGRPGMLRIQGLVLDRKLRLTQKQRTRKG